MSNSVAPLVRIMDEPTAALAVAEVDAVLQLIRRVSSQGVSVILVTHRLQDLFVVCDRIMVMYEGKCVAERLIGSLVWAHEAGPGGWTEPRTARLRRQLRARSGSRRRAS